MFLSFSSKDFTCLASGDILGNMLFFGSVGLQNLLFATFLSLTFKIELSRLVVFLLFNKFNILLETFFGWRSITDII